MALHLTPEAHDADPPAKWLVVKAADRCWHLDSSLGGTIESHKRKRDAEAAKVSGWGVRQYEKEGRWFRGEPAANCKPYAEVCAERERNVAKWPDGPLARRLAESRAALLP